MAIQQLTKFNYKLINDIARGLFTSAGAVAEILVISYMFRFPISLDFILIIIFTSLSIYLFDFFREDRIPNLGGENPKSFLYLFPVIFGLSSLFLVIFYGNLISTIVFIALALYGLLYDPIFKQFTKHVVAFKDIYVALGWTAMLFLYAIYFSIPYSISFAILFLFVFSRDLVNVSYCDLKDTQVDNIHKLKTLANALGRKKLITTIEIVNIISIFILLLGYSFLGFPPIVLSLIIPVIITSIAIIFSKNENQYSPYIVDSEYIVWYISALLVGTYVAIP